MLRTGRISAADFFVQTRMISIGHILCAVRPRSALPPGGVDLEDVERQLLVQALERFGGNQTHAGAHGSLRGKARANTYPSSGSSGSPLRMRADHS